MLDFFNSILKTVSLSHLNILLVLGLALFGGTIGGRLFQKLKIPQVVGYIIIGIIIGQSGLQLVPQEIASKFEPFNYFALGLISFMIGGELKLSTLKKYGRQFLYILFFEALGAFFLVGLFVFIVMFLILQNIILALGLALLLGSISAATAPASTTDVLWEYKTRGPLTSTVFGIVALDDILALLLFAVCSSVSTIFLGKQGGNILGELLNLLYEVGAAVLVGAGSGFLLARLLRAFHDEEKTLTFSIGAILLVLGLSVALNLDMLLSSMIMGVLITNLAPIRSKELFSLLGRIATPIYVLFFVLVGTSLNIIGIDLMLGVLASVYLIGRTAGKIFGARLGGALSKAVPAVRKYLPLCLFSQAGVAIGLAIFAQQKFPGEIGNAIVIVITATTFIVQLIGPSFVRYAVTKAGEVGLNITEDDLIKTIKTQEVLAKKTPLIPENTKLKKVLSIFSRHDYLYYPVVDKKKCMLGVISINSIKETFSHQELSDFLLAHDIMETPVTTCAPDTPLAQVDEMLKHYHLDYIPVVKPDKRVAGIIERRGIQRFIATKLLDMEKKTKALG
ncbi:MAG: cation:proton antiporter [Spirochaetales bacterium]|nr:cation:proton antiporter [Spirochaetales bacterium]